MLWNDWNRLFWHQKVPKNRRLFKMLPYVKKKRYFLLNLTLFFCILAGGPHTHVTTGEHKHQFTITPVSSASSLNPSENKPRSRPLTGESGASSSSATPSLKSVEQSSQESATSSDDGGEVGNVNDVIRNHGSSGKESSKKHVKMRSAANHRVTSSAASSGAAASQQPQSTWI